MHCPFCGNEKTRVIDKRTRSDGLVNRRRRVCPECKRRFTTHEKTILTPITVIKSHGGRERFKKRKISEGIVKACLKRPVDVAIINRIISDVESKIFEMGVSEIKSETIGKMVLEELEKVDEVAYLRFASIHKNFENINSFEKEMFKLKNLEGKSS